MKHKINEIPAGEFKAKCLRLMDDVKNKHIVILITKRGKPVAKLVPIEEDQVDLFGCMKGTVKICGDIISPIDAEWEANK